MSRMITLMAAVLCGSAVHAQDSLKTSQLDQVVVTATRFQQKQSTTGKVVTVIDQEMIRKSAGRTLTELLNYQAGMFVNGANNSPGSNIEIYLRGSGHGKSLILLDGIPVNDPSLSNNGYDLNNIALSQVERIEILKGAQSTLWGSDAIAGVINIITKKPANAQLRPSAWLSYGSFNTIRAGAGISGKANALSYQLSYQHTRSDGFSSAYDSSHKGRFDRDGLKQHNLQAILGYRLNDELSVRFNGNYSSYKADLDGGAFKDDRDNVSDNRSATGTVELIYQTNALQLHLSQSHVYSKRDYLDDSTHVGGFAKYAEGSYTGRSWVTDFYGNIRLHKHLSLVAGAQYLANNTSQDYLSISDWGPFVTALGDTAKSKNLSVYGSLLFAVGGFNLEAGLRYNNHNIYGGNQTFSFNPSYNIDKHSRVFVNISSGYKVPTLYQLYSEYGNRELKPEESYNYELGYQYTSDERKHVVRVVGFKRDIRNVIIYYFDPVTFEEIYLNREKQHDYGFELESANQLAKNIRLTSTLSYVDGKGKNGSLKTSNLYRRPNLSFNTSVDIAVTDKLNVMPGFRYVGSRLKGEYDPGPEKLPSYYTLDLYAGYQFSKSIRAFVDLRNLTDQLYFDVPGYRSRGFNVTAGLYLNL